MAPKRGRKVVEPWRVSISNADLAAGTTDWDTIQKGLEAYHEYGFIILENAIPHKIVDKYHDQMTADIQRKMTAGNIAYNHGNNTNFTLSLPLSSEWLDEEVWGQYTFRIKSIPLTIRTT